MATPREKLVSSLEKLKNLQKNDSVIRTKDLSRTHRERLITHGFIREVIKGWYIATSPKEVKGDSTSWFGSFWDFCKSYLNERFSDDWWLSPEQSIAIHGGNWSVPKQLLVRSSRASNNQTDLLFETSIFDHQSNLSEGVKLEIKEGIRILSLPWSLIHCSPTIFKQSSIDMRTGLSMINDASQVLEPLLDGGHSIIAGRLAGAFRNIGNGRIADEIISAMSTAGFDVREQDPFENKLPSIFNIREPSPYVNRIKMMWSDMREVALDYFPKAPGLPQDPNDYLKQVDELFVSDAYHSLSIEGYQVSEELIERVRTGDWNPEDNEEDHSQINAMAARGYWQAFQSVKKTILNVLSGKNSGEAVDHDHGEWYRELFGPSVTTGLLKPSDLAGYRNGPVYIKRSQHVPQNSTALRDTMPVLVELLEKESEAAIRAVLGHFIFVYIHPYMDGNGRMARFLMNVMLASGGYPWTIIQVKDRSLYMQVLEQASVGQNLQGFSKFLGDLVTEQMNSMLSESTKDDIQEK